MLTTHHEGPCAGHPCDRCVTCQAGRCCRSDNPDYRLPELGDWIRPYFGRLGVLADDGVKVECHICGTYYRFLGNHVVRAHDVTADEYRAYFGLNCTTGLTGPDLRKIRVANGKRLHAWDLEHGVEPGRNTPEQMSARLKGQPKRLETKIRPETHAKRVELGGQQMRRINAGEYGPVPRPTPEESRQIMLRNWERWRADPAANFQRWRREQEALGRTVVQVNCPVCGTAFWKTSTHWRLTCGKRECAKEAHRRAVQRNGRQQCERIWATPELREKLITAVVAACKRRRKPRQEHRCPICGAPFFSIPHDNKVTCGRPDCKSANRSNKSRGRRHTADARARIAQAKRDYWAARRAAAGAPSPKKGGNRNGTCG